MTITALWQKLRQTGALMVGVPDYARYVAHMREVHPELAPLSEAEFVKGRMEARYGGGKMGKCPC
jgi:uncharacterized short protein YbdD (DUF466 family)